MLSCALIRDRCRHMQEDLHREHMWRSHICCPQAVSETAIAAGFDEEAEGPPEDDRDEEAVEADRERGWSHANTSTSGRSEEDAARHPRKQVCLQQNVFLTSAMSYGRSMMPRE